MDLPFCNTVYLAFSKKMKNQIWEKDLFEKTLLEPGGIDHLESDRNSQFELNRNSQCTLAN